MGYPEDVLAPDERIVVHRHTHWKALIWPVMAFVVLTAGVVALYTWVRGQDWSDTTETVIGIAAGVLWLIGVSWLSVIPFVQWATTHFVVTDRRVMYRTGILTRSGIDIPLGRVNSVQFRHGLIDRILRTGTLIIESASDDPLEFADIPQVEKVHSLLYHEVHDTLEDVDHDEESTGDPTAPAS